ncbi:hypothetical protein GF376_03355, partial [Candidatus Peregrinibacteria bacterium]|nr:hypothetical protein [Candidatus Peregrinibacteria bacterium]
MQKQKDHNPRLIYNKSGEALKEQVALEAAKKVKAELASYPQKREEAVKGAKTNIEKHKQNKDQESLPAIPKKYSALQLKEKSKKATTEGKIEQEFTFGESKLKGKIEYPKNPDSKSKTKLVINFESDSNSDQDLSKSLEKQGVKLDNTIVVTIQTPQGKTVKFGKEEADFMSTLISDIELFQKNSGMKLKDRPMDIITATDPENYKKRIRPLLLQYEKTMGKNDPRVSRMGHLSIEDIESKPLRSDVETTSPNPNP